LSAPITENGVEYVEIWSTLVPIQQQAPFHAMLMSSIDQSSEAMRRAFVSAIVPLLEQVGMIGDNQQKLHNKVDTLQDLFEATNMRVKQVESGLQHTQMQLDLLFEILGKLVLAVPEAATLQSVVGSLKKCNLQGKEGEIVSEVITTVKRLESDLDRQSDLYDSKFFVDRDDGLRKYYRHLLLTQSTILRNLAQQSTIESTIFCSSNANAQEFWRTHFKSSLEVSWNDFILAYRVAVVAMEVRHETALCNSLSLDNVVSCYTFESGVHRFNFPFDITMFPIPITSWSPEARLMLVSNFQRLMDQFYANEMSIATLGVRQYLMDESGKRLSGTALDSKAEQWAIIVKCTPRLYWLKDIRLSEEQRVATAVNEYRKMWGCFFENYMVLWRTAQIAYANLSDIDFPGKGRIRDYLLFCEPLDFYNNTIVLQCSPSEWNRRCPKRYKFLRRLLEEMGNDKPIAPYQPRK
jgi:hypothetical protein